MNDSEFIAYCKTHLGKPYIWGSDGPNTFDCSGFVQYVLQKINLDPKDDQTAHSLFLHFKQSQNGTVVTAGQCGVLVFYGKSNRVTHVAICINASEIIEAGGGGSRTTTVEAAKKQNAEVRIKPISRRKDIIAMVLPKHLPWL